LASSTLLELRFEPLEQGERVRRGAGEARDHRAVAEAAQLLGVRLDDGLAHRHLAVAGDHHAIVLAHTQDGGAMPSLG